MHLPILSIVGPTASGKTGLALKLADALIANGTAEGAAIISADSRQVYQGIETLTGADIPENFVKIDSKDFEYEYYAHAENKNVFLYGVSIIKLSDEWSVAHFRKMSQELITDYTVKKYIIIIVGGTGLYHDHLLSTDPAINIGPNTKLREKVAQLTMEQLKHEAEKADPMKFKRMNNSDQNNPRRLVRLLEISEAGVSFEPQSPTLFENLRHLYFGLSVETEELEKNILSRVMLRLSAGAVLEVENAVSELNSGNIADPVYKTLGFREILAYSEGEITKEECIGIWSKKEISYSKRQMTWFKKNKDITWLKSGDPGIVNKALACYTEIYDVPIL